MRALLCILLLAGIAFSAAGSVSTESLPLDFTNPYVQTDAPTESLPLDFFNPYIETNSPTEALPLEFFNPYIETDSPTEELSIDWTSFGVDFPVIFALALSPNPINFRYQSLSISANLTSAYSQGIISNVTANITGCGDGFIIMSKQSGTCSSSCIYTGAFSPTQDSACLVTITATDSLGKYSSLQGNTITEGTRYLYAGTTDENGIAGINATVLPSASSLIRIETSKSSKASTISTSAESLYVNIRIRLGLAPEAYKNVTLEVI